ncbi:MAG: hypothetical protein IPG04_11495 [Polyangiaceae bacterium]|nr:hypothetical protein [Polyangiaceae bacterium]
MGACLDRDLGGPSPELLLARRVGRLGEGGVLEHGQRDVERDEIFDLGEAVCGLLVVLEVLVDATRLQVLARRGEALGGGEPVRADIRLLEADGGAGEVPELSEQRACARPVLGGLVLVGGLLLVAELDEDGCRARVLAAPQIDPGRLDQVAALDLDVPGATQISAGDGVAELRLELAVVARRDPRVPAAQHRDEEHDDHARDHVADRAVGEKIHVREASKLEEAWVRRRLGGQWTRPALARRRAFGTTISR